MARFIKHIVFVALALYLISLLTACSSAIKTSEVDKVSSTVNIPPPSPPPVIQPAKETVIIAPDVERSTSLYASMAGPTTAYLSAPKLRVALREFIYRSQPLKGTDYNLVVINEQPVDDETFKKVIYICELWKKTVPDKQTYDEIYKENKNVELIPFYWPLRKKINSDSCQELVVNYDYERVQLLAQTLRIKNKSPQFLYRTSNAIITMDLSVITDKKDIYLAMGTWRENMCLQFDKDTKIKPVSMVQSVKKVLGILSDHLTIKM